MPRHMNPEHRGFHHFSAAWYGAKLLENERDGGIRVIDRISFGLFPEGGGTQGEMLMTWLSLGRGVPSPRLCVFDDAWDVLVSFSDVTEAMGDVSHTAPTPAQFIEILKRCGFRDLTRRTQE